MKMNKKALFGFTKRYISYIIIAAVALVYTALTLTSGVKTADLYLLEKIAIAIILAVSLGMVVGFLGELSLGHAGFMCVGAYLGGKVSVLLEPVLGNSLPTLLISLLAGGLVAALAGLIIGLPALRLRGDYLAIVTLAFGEIVKNIIINLKFTGGAIGYDTQDIYQSPKSFALFPYAAVAVFVAVVLVMNLTKSKHGRAITAVRDNKIAASATGVNATYFKLVVFSFAAFLAGVAGVLWGHSGSIIKASTFDFNMSIEILVIVVLGGMGSIRGSVIAAVVLKLLPEVLRNLNEDLVKYRMLIYSVMLILIMLFNSAPAFVAFRERLNIKNLFKVKKSKKEKDEKEVA